MGKKKNRADITSTHSQRTSAEEGDSNPVSHTDVNSPGTASQGVAGQNDMRSSVSQEDLSDLQDTLRPRINELDAKRNELTKGFADASGLIDVILKIYHSRVGLLSEVQESWEECQKKAERELFLDNLVTGLERRREEEAKIHEAELAALRKDLETEKNAKREMENVCKQDYEAREQELVRREAKLTKSKAIAAKELELKEQKWKEDHSEFVNQLQRELAELRGEQDTTKTQLEQARLEIKKTDRAYDSLSKETESLQAQLEHMQQEAVIFHRNDADFIQPLDRIREALGRLCRDHFTELPSSAIQDSNHTSRKLEETSILFSGTPISDSPVSVGLRRARVCHLIVRLICEKIWQPFFSTTLWNRCEIRSFLANVSSNLLLTGAELESRWRNTTLQAITYHSGALGDFIEHLNEEVTSKLRPLLTDTSLTAFQDEFRNILRDAITFWEEAQKDGTRISVIAVPSKPYWDEALTFIIPEEELQGAFAAPSRSRDFDPLLIFPEVVRHSSQTNPDASHRRDVNIAQEQTDQILYRGLAMFADTHLFDLGSDELEAIAEATKEVPFRIGGQRKRGSLTTRSETLNSIPIKDESKL